MKKYFIILIVVAVVSLCSCSERRSFLVDADVLSINSNILEGQLIGAFLSSPSGRITNDVNKVGVTFVIQGQRFFYDLKMLHSELSFYRNKKTIPLGIYIRRMDMDEIYIYLGNRKIYEETVGCLPISLT